MKIESKQLRPELRSIALVCIAAAWAIGHSVVTRAQTQWTTTGNDISNTNSGNVGVGTSDPSTPLSMGGSWGNSGLTIGNGSARAGLVLYSSATSPYSSVRFAAGTSGAYDQGFLLYKHSANFMSFGTNRGTRMTIDSNGNVGIGATDPTTPLVQAGWNGKGLTVGNTDSGTSGGVVIVSDPASTLSSLRFGNGTSGVYDQGFVLYNHSSNFMSFGTSRGTRMTIDSSGNIGIGTTNPDTSLNVKAAHNTWRIGDVYSSSNQYAGISDTAPDATSYFLLSRLGVGGGDRYVNAPTGGSLDLQIGGTSAISILSNRNVGIGKPNPTVALDVVGSINLTGTVNAKYQDVAEWVPSSERLSPGTVVVLDSTKSNQVTSSLVSYDTRVAGVVSEQPGIALGEKSDTKVLVATTGRVKVKVDASKGAIHIGDLLVTSDVPGTAMKSEPMIIGGRQFHAPGTLIGKALEPLEKGSGEILVLLSLQ